MSLGILLLIAQVTLLSSFLIYSSASTIGTRACKFSSWCNIEPDIINTSGFLKHTSSIRLKKGKEVYIIVMYLGDDDDDEYIAIATCDYDMWNLRNLY